MAVAAGVGIAVVVDGRGFFAGEKVVEDPLPGGIGAFFEGKEASMPSCVKGERERVRVAKGSSRAELYVRGRYLYP